MTVISPIATLNRTRKGINFDYVFAVFPSFIGCIAAIRSYSRISREKIVLARQINEINAVPTRTGS